MSKGTEIEIENIKLRVASHYIFSHHVRCCSVLALHRLMQEQNRQVGRKLGIATACMFTLPIMSFYLGLWMFADKKEPDNWAGGLAIVVTNIVVAGYCWSAFSEEEDPEEEKNDAAGPRVGIFKQRTD